MNRRSLVSAALLLLLPLLTVSAGAEPYEAGHGFQTGGVYFHVVSVSPDSGALFRVGERLRAEGADEHPDCYRVGRAYYHREACPVLQAHLARHGAEAGSDAPTATANRATGAPGSHPIDYLRGSYVERESSRAWDYPGLYYGPWLGSGGHGFRRPGFRGTRGHFGRGFGLDFRGSRSIRVSFRRW